jgi:hypothetical protein
MNLQRRTTCHPGPVLQNQSPHPVDLDGIRREELIVDLIDDRRTTVQVVNV